MSTTVPTGPTSPTAPSGGTTRPRLTAAGATAVLRTEARLFGRELGSLFWILLFPTVLLLVLGAVPSFREPDEALGGARVVDVYTSVSVLLAAIMAALMAMPSVVASYRERGILRRLRTTPAHPGSVLLAQVVVHAVAVLVSIVLVLTVARVVFDVSLPQEVAWYAVCLVLAVVGAFAIGAVVTAVAPTTRLAQTIATIVFFPTMFTAGVWSPVPALQGWLHTVVTATPMGAAAELLTDTAAGRTPDLADLLVAGGWSLVLAVLAARLFRWE